MDTFLNKFLSWLVVFSVIISLIFPRKDCLQQAERDALGRWNRPEKDTVVFSPSRHFNIHYNTNRVQQTN